MANSNPSHYPSPTGFCNQLDEVLSSIASLEEDLGNSVKILACSLDKATTTKDVVKILNALPDTIYALILLEQATIKKLSVVCECQNCKNCGCNPY